MKFWCRILTLAVCLAAAPGSARAVDESFKADVQKYLSLSDAKAFAIAEDSGGMVVWGFGYSQPSIEEAMKVALKACSEQKEHFTVKAECKVVMIGNALLSSNPSPHDSLPSGQHQEPQQSQISYETRWVNGVSFLVATSHELQVWVAFFKGKDPQALIYLVNGTQASITFAPESIRARYLREGRRGPEEITIKTFSASEYEKKVRDRQALAAALLGAAAALSNQPQPQSSTFNGGYTTTGPGVTGYGSFYGSITQWPSASDYAAANARTAAQVQAMGSQLQRSFQAMSSTLMRTQTLIPGSYYGGVVHFGRHKGSAVNLVIPFAETDFSFQFTY